MAVVAAVPLFMSNATLKIDADNYEAAVNSVTLTPSNNTATFKGLTPTAIYKRTGNSEWVCEIQFVQDWATVGSLANYLFTNEGLTKTMVFVPLLAGKTVTAQVTIVPGSIGGAVDGFATSTVQLLVSGKPVLT